MSRRNIVVVTVLAALVLLVALLLVVANGKTTGTVKKTSTAQLKDKVNKPQSLNGQRFFTMYPGSYSLNSDTLKDKASLEQYTFLASLPDVRHTALTIRPTPAGGLSNDADYHMRQVYSGQYSESIKTVAGQTVNIMTKIDGGEVAAFMVHGPYLATIVVTSDDPNGSVEDDLMGFISDWKWRQ